MEKQLMFCEKCNRNVLASRKTPSHDFHLVMTICSFWWAIIWGIVTLSFGFKWNCDRCHSRL